MICVVIITPKNLLFYEEHPFGIFLNGLLTQSIWAYEIPQVGSFNLAFNVTFAQEMRQVNQSTHQW